MKTVWLSLLFIQVTLPLFAQTDEAGAGIDLQPYKISGRESPFKRNLSFAGYKTFKLRRSIASWFSSGSFNIKNPGLSIGGTQLYKKEKHRSVDIFSFVLKTEAGIVSRTKCRAVMRKKETFNVFRQKEPSFFKNENVDYLEARIQTDKDTSHIWYLSATNLNGSMDEAQQGVIKCGNQEIRFVKTTSLLRDEPVGRDDVKSLFTSINTVYLFTYNDKNIAAVGLSMKDKKFWCRDDLNSHIKAVVVSAASLLCLRQNLYY